MNPVLIHEASHCVVGTALGRKVESVQTSRDSTDTPINWGRAIFTDGDTPDNQLRTAVAGQLGELTIFGSISTHISQSDAREIEGAIKELSAVECHAAYIHALQIITYNREIIVELATVFDRLDVNMRSQDTRPATVPRTIYASRPDTVQHGLDFERTNGEISEILARVSK